MIKILSIIIAIMCTIIYLTLCIWGVAKKKEMVAVIYFGLQSIINIVSLVIFFKF